MRVRVRKAAWLLADRAKRYSSFAVGRPRLTWSIAISAPDDSSGDVWGDVFFADDLARALRRRGQVVYVDRLDTRARPVSRVRDDVVLQLVGLHRPVPVPGAVNLLWLISHPELVTDAELAQPWSRIYAASVPWSERRTAAGTPVHPLLQATDPERFSPLPGGGSAARSGEATDVLFVGKTRAVYRPIIRDAVEAGADLAVFGDGWEQFIQTRHIRADFLDNELVPDAYRRARIVLNDHWADMAEQGFVSNRLFDAVATGARVISDPVHPLPPEFGGSVRVYEGVDEMRRLLDPSDTGWPDEEQRRRNASDVGKHHSFDARAEELLRDARLLRGRLKARRGGAVRRTPA